jgi:hypothetical protein
LQIIDKRSDDRPQAALSEVTEATSTVWRTRSDRSMDSMIQ